MAATLRTAATNLILQSKSFAEATAAMAETLNALAEMYEGANPKREPAKDPAKPAEKINTATDAAVQITATKEVAMRLMNLDGNRDRFNALLTKHAGGVKPLAELDGDTLKALADDCEAAIAAGKPASMDAL